MVIDDSGIAMLTLFDRDYAKYIGVLVEQLRKSVKQIVHHDYLLIYFSNHIELLIIISCRVYNVILHFM